MNNIGTKVTMPPARQKCMHFNCYKLTVLAFLACSASTRKTCWNGMRMRAKWAFHSRFPFRFVPAFCIFHLPMYSPHILFFICPPHQALHALNVKPGVDDKIIIHKWTWWRISKLSWYWIQFRVMAWPPSMPTLLSLHVLFWRASVVWMSNAWPCTLDHAAFRFDWALGLNTLMSPNAFSNLPPP